MKLTGEDREEYEQVHRLLSEQLHLPVQYTKFLSVRDLIILKVLTDAIKSN